VAEKKGGALVVITQPVGRATFPVQTDGFAVTANTPNHAKTDRPPRQ